MEPTMAKKIGQDLARISWYGYIVAFGAPFTVLLLIICLIRAIV